MQHDYNNSKCVFPLQVNKFKLFSQSCVIICIYFLLLRFTELDIQEKYSLVREVLNKKLHKAATIVNQTILLCRLHDTRICDPFLEPIIEDIICSDDGIVHDNNISY